MELITSKRRNELITATPGDPRCAALVGRYGDAAGMMAVWSPAKASAIAAKAAHSEAAPSLVLMMLTYGSDTLAALLSAHAAAAIDTAGLSDRFTADDCRTIARMITEDESLRTLNMAYLIRFFAQFGRGVFELYGFTPYTFMRSLQTYARQAHAEQRRMMEEAAIRREREEREEHARAVEEIKRAIADGTADDPLTQFVESLKQQTK